MPAARECGPRAPLRAARSVMGKADGRWCAVVGGQTGAGPDECRRIVEAADRAVGRDRSADVRARCRRFPGGAQRRQPERRCLRRSDRGRMLCDASDRCRRRVQRTRLHGCGQTSGRAGFRRGSALRCADEERQQQPRCDDVLPACQCPSVAANDRRSGGRPSGRLTRSGAHAAASGQLRSATVLHRRSSTVAQGGGGCHIAAARRPETALRRACAGGILPPAIAGRRGERTARTAAGGGGSVSLHR
jgi:hypothetical protein